MFGKSWEPAEATIVLVNVKHVSSSGSTVTYEYAADVRKADGTVVRAKIDEPRLAIDFWPPSVGDVLKVEVEAKSGKVRFDMDDPKLSVKAHERATKDAFAAALEQAPGSPTAAPVPAIPMPGVDMPGGMAGLGALGLSAEQVAALMARSQGGVVDLRGGGEDAQALRASILKAMGQEPPSA